MNVSLFGKGERGFYRHYSDPEMRSSPWITCMGPLPNDKCLCKLHTKGETRGVCNVAKEAETGAGLSQGAPTATDAG